MYIWNKEEAKDDIQQALSRNKLDSLLATPDYVLAEIIMDFLVFYNNARKKRNDTKNWAKWVKTEDGLYKCSWCGGINHGVEKHYYNCTKYCPDCGCEMEFVE